LVDGTSYYYFVRCQDTAGNINSDDFVINFSVSSSQPTCEDLDGDGYGSPASTACSYPELDCDDSDPQVNPGMTEVPYNGKNDDCDPNTSDDDLDGDGFCVNPGNPLALPGMRLSSPLTCDPRPDCDDVHSQVNPGMTEIPYNEFDDDCDPSTPNDDLDNDNHVLAQDCDDLDPLVYDGVEVQCGPDTNMGACQFGTKKCNGWEWGECTGAVYPQAEQCNNVDDDCDGNTDEDFDLDEDGYTTCALPTPDCDDSDALVYPNAVEVCDDNIDQDCDGSDLECVDCNSSGETESCTTLDNCAGTRTCGADLFWGQCVKDDLCCGVNCNDGDSCTVDSCDSLTGTCVFNRPDPCCGKTCDDGNPCTTDSCDSLTGTCSFTPIPNCDGGTNGNGKKPPKNFSVTVSEKICVDEDFAVTVKDKSSGELLHRVRVVYGPATKDTDRYGRVSFIALKEQNMLVLDKAGYNTLNLAISPVECLKPLTCGNNECEPDQGEDEFNCPQDCSGQTPKPTEKSLLIEVPEKVMDKAKFTLVVKDQDGNPVKDAKVVYGILVEFTDEKGKVTLTAYKGFTEITAEKEGYEKAVASIKIVPVAPSPEIDPLVLVAVTLMIIVVIVVLIFKFGVIKQGIQ
jgi:hypothetical protein